MFFNRVVVFTFLMWCAMCYNFSRDAFVAGLAETRTNRQNYLRAFARCSHSWGDLQTSFSVHASQRWSLLRGARSAHRKVLRSRGKTFWMVMAMELVHKTEIKYHPDIIPWASQSGGEELWKGMFERFLCFCSENRIQSGSFYFQDLHQRIADRARASSRVSLSTIMSGFTKDVLPGGVEGGGGKCPQTA